MSHFPFLRLPPEVRMMIYEQVMGSSLHDNKPGDPGSRIRDPIFVKTTSHTRSGKGIRPLQDRQAYKNATPQLALAFTCRQIYPEATRIWYSNVKFTFPCAERMEAFMRSITKDNLNAIRHVRLHLGHNYSDTLRADCHRMFELMAEFKGLPMWDLDTGCPRGTPKWRDWKMIGMALLLIRDSVQRVSLLGPLDWQRRVIMSDGRSRYMS
ncbi:hypothetical protein MMC30_007421 [Trapelia coarctata]|nr:hypothetical protein [Trapelia coarctata]